MCRQAEGVKHTGLLMQVSDGKERSDADVHMLWRGLMVTGKKLCIRVMACMKVDPSRLAVYDTNARACEFD